MFKQKLASVLLDDEDVVAGRGYQHAKCNTPGNADVSQKFLHAPPYKHVTRAVMRD